MASNNGLSISSNLSVSRLSVNVLLGLSNEAFWCAFSQGVHNNGSSVSRPDSLLLYLMSPPDLEEEPYLMMTSLSPV